MRAEPGLLFAFVLCVFTSFDLHAHEPPPGKSNLEAVDVDPTLKVLEKRRCRATDSCQAKVILEFDDTPDFDTERARKRLGIRISGAIGRYVGAMIPLDNLEEVSKLPELERIESLWRPTDVNPLSETVPETGIDIPRRMPSINATGEGAIIGVVDSGVDIFHPAFFRADGAYFSWVDVNGNGEFDPGIDGVDLNGNGEIEPGRERLRLLDSTIVTDIIGRETDHFDTELDPAEDWLYADTNNNRRRDVGTDAGFFETTPAYGEPLFVADDIDDDGELDMREKIRRLNTSKIKRYQKGDKTYIRGRNLIDAGTDRGREVRHGTGTIGILVGGQPQYHRRIGMAPKSEVVVFGRGEQRLGRSLRLPFDSIAEAASLDLDLLLHEWTSPFTQPLDGSTSLEGSIQQRRCSGLLQVVPAGNLASSNKHRVEEINSGERLEFEFEVDEGFEQGESIYPYREVFGSFQWNDDMELDIELRDPGGNVYPIYPDSPDSDQSQYVVESASDLTPGGTRHIEFYLSARQQADSLPEGVWQFDIENKSGAARLIGRISDGRSDWSGGVGWTDGKDSQYSLAYPASAPAGFVVGAYDGYSETRALRHFSGRGPTMDGRRGVDITAPGNPFVPLGMNSTLRLHGFQHGWFRRFGGTSGASAHVAGGIAAIRGLYPEHSPSRIEERLAQSARQRQLIPPADSLPDKNWGYGRLDLHRLLTDQTRRNRNNRAPSIESSTGESSRSLFLKVTAQDPEGQTSEVRFDVGYDGTWNYSWGETRKLSWNIDEIDSRKVVKIQARDSLGASTDRLVEVSLSRADSVESDIVESDAGKIVDRRPGPCCHATGRSSTSGFWMVLIGVLVVISRRKQRT